MKPDTKSTLRKWAIYAAIIAGVYFANVEVQTYLGEKALQATGLEAVPLDRALTLAARDDKLILADMSAIWCPTCRRLDRIVFSDSRVQEAIANGYVFSRIEYESAEGEAFMEKYSVFGYPTLLVLNPDGSLVRRLPLTFDPDAFIANL